MDDDSSTEGTEGAKQMFTIIDVTTGESVQDTKAFGPILFDTEAEAEAFAVQFSYTGPDFRIAKV